MICVFTVTVIDCNAHAVCRTQAYRAGCTLVKKVAYEANLTVAFLLIYRYVAYTATFLDAYTATFTEPPRATVREAFLATFL